MLRYSHPELPRPFRVPFGILLPSLGIVTCLYLMFSLPGITWLRLFVWLAIGLIVYFSYSRQHSSLANR